ncbi:MAG: outer membrane lipoprotein carrier protein LolA [Acetobacteraceae bacterium]|nr:outer membrane lipoprotein carrier protein LolA [Acetobacteraceae bacterium]
MKRLASALLLALAAQTATASETAQVHEGQVLRGHFMQERRMQGFAKPLRSSGTFVVAPGIGLIWHAEQPFEVTTIVTRAGLTQQLAGDEIMQLSAAKLPFLSRLNTMMSGALSGDWHALETDFSLARTAGGRVTLTPRRTDDLASGGILRIDASVGRFVEAVDIVRPNGESDHLGFTDQQVAGALLPQEAAALGVLPR